MIGQRLALGVRHNLGHYVAGAFDHSHNDGLASRATSGLAATNAADVGFVHFNVAEQFLVAVNIGHVLANLMSHAPRGFVRHAKRSFQFLRRYPVARRAEKVDGIEPQLQRSACILKRCASARVDVMAAPLARVARLALDAMKLARLAALRALRLVAKPAGHDMIKANVVVCKGFEELANRHLSTLFSYLHQRVSDIQYVCQWDNYFG